MRKKQVYENKIYESGLKSSIVAVSAKTTASIGLIPTVLDDRFVTNHLFRVDSSIEQQYFDFSFESTIKVVNEYREKYNLISQLLDENPQLVSLAHHDLAKMLSQSSKGRKSSYTSEQILRCLIVQFIKQQSFRDVVVSIENREFLRNFVRLGVNHMMDYSFLNKAYDIISEKTWDVINQVVAEYAAPKGLEPSTFGSTVRTRGL